MIFLLVLSVILFLLCAIFLFVWAERRVHSDLFPRERKHSIISHAGFISIIAFLLGSGSCVGGCSLGTDRETARGEQVGTISHYGSEGLIWKTNEGEMTLGIIQNGSGSVHTGTQKFCILDSNISEQVQKAVSDGTPVRVFYKEIFFIPPWKCGHSDTLIERIEEFAPRNVK
jgi:hypothetical protein